MKKKKNRSPQAEMTFLEHLEELRQRILISVASIIVCFIVIYGLFRNQISGYFLFPMQEAILGKGKFQFTSPTEGFLFNLKISFLAGVFASSPMLFYQFWKFVAPALYRHEKRYIIPFIIFSTIFFVGGASFGYFIVFPIGFKFFSQFASPTVEINPKLAEYFSFATKFLLAFGLTFELPLVMVFLARLGLVSTSFLNRNRKYAIIIIFTIAAILTPGPDVLSQVLLAFPLWALYELSGLLVWIFQKKEEDQTT